MELKYGWILHASLPGGGVWFFCIYTDSNSECRIFVNYTSSFFKGASLTNLFAQILQPKRNGFWIKTDGLGGVKSKHVGF